MSANCGMPCRIGIIVVSRISRSISLMREPSPLSTSISAPCVSTLRNTGCSSFSGNSESSRRIGVGRASPSSALPSTCAKILDPEISSWTLKVTSPFSAPAATRKYSALSRCFSFSSTGRHSATGSTRKYFARGKRVVDRRRPERDSDVDDGANLEARAT